MSATCRGPEQFIVFVIDVIIIVVDKPETGNSTFARLRSTGSTTGDGRSEIRATVEDAMTSPRSWMWSVWRRSWKHTTAGTTRWLGWPISCSRALTSTCRWRHRRLTCAVVWHVDMTSVVATSSTKCFVRKTDCQSAGHVRSLTSWIVMTTPPSTTRLVSFAIYVHHLRCIPHRKYQQSRYY